MCLDSFLPKCVLVGLVSSGFFSTKSTCSVTSSVLYSEKSASQSTILTRSVLLLRLQLLHEMSLLVWVFVSACWITSWKNQLFLCYGTAQQTGPSFCIFFTLSHRQGTVWDHVCVHISCSCTCSCWVYHWEPLTFCRRASSVV